MDVANLNIYESFVSEHQFSISKYYLCQYLPPVCCKAPVLGSFILLETALFSSKIRLYLIL